ncbi:Retrovirus-related Pol polyprotein from transposon TNT 1-94 [Senna tora]|uniref:Retrovirus-related Pol polyprotein from transposon TNT 1-94 n=1 Tax=Senna tora TaxID=362788 RepID=A0A834SWP4_9FABA|nr:Retrovirus-related Pol polyprotein from transposon TNT 1-94 [Senna tora]
MRKDDYSVTEIEALLLAQEARHEKVKKQVENVSANVAQRSFLQNGRGQQSFHKGGFQNGRGGNGFFSQRGGFQNGGAQRRGFLNGNSQNRSFRVQGGRVWQNSKPQCQVCGRMGHIGVNCYNRFNQSFTEATLVQFISQNQNSQNKQNGGVSAEALLATPETLNDDAWFADNDASNHLTNDVSNLQVKQSYDGGEQVHIANGSGSDIVHIGNSELLSNSKIVKLNQILHVSKNLLSISKFAKDNRVFFEFHSERCFVKSQDDHRVLLEGRIKRGLYLFDSLNFSHKVSNPVSVNTASTNVSSSACSFPFVAIFVSSSSNFGLWHCRLGHLAFPVVKSVLTACNLPTLNNKNDAQFCEACCLGKIHAVSFPSSSTMYNFPLELVYSDLWGPAPVNSSRNFRYYISFVDAFSKYTWVYLLKAKSNAFEAFKMFKAQAELQLNTKIKSFQSDSGGEFRSFSKFLEDNGIQHRLSCPHTHQQNVSAERKHRHIIEVTLSLLAHASLPLKFWDEAILSSVFLVNRLPTPVLNGSCPLQKHPPTSVSFVVDPTVSSSPSVPIVLTPINSTHTRVLSTQNLPTNIPNNSGLNVAGSLVPSLIDGSTDEGSESSRTDSARVV